MVKSFLTTLACFATISILAETTSLPKSDSARREEILRIASSFWTAMNLGDMEDLKPLVRGKDVELIPTPKERVRR